MDGVGNVCYRYALNFGEKGHESYVVSPQTDTGYRGNYPFEIVDYTGIPLFKMKSYRVGMPGLDIHCQRRLGMIGADIAHLHTPFIAGQAGLAYAKKHKVPTVGMFHSKYYDDFLQITGVELLADVGVKFVVDFYEKCDEVWAVSRSSADTLKGYGCKKDIFVIPNGTDIPDLDPDREEELLSGFNLNKSDPILLYVGQMNRKKNIHCILEAAADVKMPFTLVMAGQGPHEEEIRKRAAELGLSERVVFTGHISDPDTLNALYKRASLFVFPSLYDTSGLVVREAAAMGTPSVVINGSSAAECIEDGINGFCCENSPSSLARAIEAVLDNPELLKKAGLKAKETIPIPWNELTDMVLDRYKTVIACHSEKQEAELQQKQQRQEKRGSR